MCVPYPSIPEPLQGRGRLYLGSESKNGAKPNSFCPRMAALKELLHPRWMQLGAGSRENIPQVLRELCANFIRCFSQRSQSKCPELWLLSHVCNPSQGFRKRLDGAGGDCIFFSPFCLLLIFPILCPAPSQQSGFLRFFPIFTALIPDVQPSISLPLP